MNDWEEKVQEIDLQRLEEGDIVRVETRSSEYHVEVLEAFSGEGRLRIGVTHERYFPEQTVFISLGIAVKGHVEPRLEVGQRMVGRYKSNNSDQEEPQTLQTSSIRSLTIDRA